MCRMMCMVLRVMRMMYGTRRQQRLSTLLAIDLAFARSLRTLRFALLLALTSCTLTLEFIFHQLLLLLDTLTLATKFGLALNIGTLTLEIGLFASESGLRTLQT